MSSIDRGRTAGPLRRAGNWLASARFPDRLSVQHRAGTLEFDTSTLTAKRWFYPRYLDGSLHEPAVSEAILDRLNEDSVFVDVGANVGFFSILAADVCAAVHSFELDPRLASIVDSHREFAAEETAPVHVVPAAVGAETREFVRFAPHLSDDPSTNQIRTADAAGGFRVPTVSIDDYVTRTEIVPDVVKVDVEGFEAAALEGLTRTLAARDGVRTLFLEVHPRKCAEYGSVADEVIDAVRDRGFSVRCFADHRDELGDSALEPVGRDGLTENTMLVCDRK